MTANTHSTQTKPLRLKADSDESIKHDERMASAICKLGGMAVKCRVAYVERLADNLQELLIGPNGVTPEALETLINDTNFMDKRKKLFHAILCETGGDRDLADSLVWFVETASVCRWQHIDGLTENLIDKIDAARELEKAKDEAAKAKKAKAKKVKAENARRKSAHLNLVGEGVAS